jgi:hypothetical protein
MSKTGKIVALTLLALIALELGRAAASPARVYEMTDPSVFSIGGLKVGMSHDQARAAVGAPVKMMGDSWYYDQEKKGVAIATFRNDRLFQIFGRQVEFKNKPARTREEMERLLGFPPSVRPDDHSAWWYVATPAMKVIIVFSAENGKPYCSLIDRTGKEF